MLLENVKGLTFDKHIPTFNKILSELDRIGYKVFWKVLNSKDYGIPQNRERVYFVCFRKELPQTQFLTTFKFPRKEKLTLFLKDILEKNVDKKYYLTKYKQKQMLNCRLKNITLNKFHINNTCLNTSFPNDICRQDRIYYSYTPTLVCQTEIGLITSLDFNSNWLRRLTPKELFRLQGFLNDNINLENLTYSQIVSLSGNGWNVETVSRIFKQMRLK